MPLKSLEALLNRSTPVKVLLFASRVVDATVQVEPSVHVCPLTVVAAFCKALLGKSSDDEAVLPTRPPKLVKIPSESAGRWNEPLNVEDAVENRPPKKPMMVEVETP